MFLLAIDAHSKWLEVHVINSATLLTTIELLQRSFACLGLPVVDNAAIFTSDEFNGTKHMRTPPYHPASASGPSVNISLCQILVLCEELQ